MCQLVGVFSGVWKEEVSNSNVKVQNKNIMALFKIYTKSLCFRLFKKNNCVPIKNVPDYLFYLLFTIGGIFWPPMNFNDVLNESSTELRWTIHILWLLMCCVTRAGTFSSNLSQRHDAARLISTGGPTFSISVSLMVTSELRRLPACHC